MSTKITLLLDCTVVCECYTLSLWFLGRHDAKHFVGHLSRWWTAFAVESSDSSCGPTCCSTSASCFGYIPYNGVVSTIAGSLVEQKRQCKRK
eukprot:2074011-Amphidinium_carterae.1